MGRGPQHFVLILLLPPLLLAACMATSGGTSVSGGERPATLRLGYFPNLTHATAIVGMEEGIIAGALGTDVTLEPQLFNAGPDAVEAIFSEAIDATYIGPNPAINAFTRSNGEAIRIIAGATSGGASLVVRSGITDPAQLAGARIASPQLGNTQDVALRAWLADQGFETHLEGGGEVSILPQSNGDTLRSFIQGEIDGAWVPEPWVTRMVQEGGGHILVDERDLWPDGQFVSVHLVVATRFLANHPDVVKRLLTGHVAANEFVNGDPAEAQRIVADAIFRLTDTDLPDGTLAAAWERLSFTVDPIASSLHASAQAQVALGLVDSAELDGIYDLALLNEVLAEAGEPEVPTP